MTEPTMLWSAGHGLRGYMPESSPYITTSWDSAKESTLEDLGFNGLGDFYFQGLPSVVHEWLHENHTHRWGELRLSSLGGTTVRDCDFSGCSVINAYDDEDDPRNLSAPDEAEVLWSYKQDGREGQLPFELDDHQWDMVKGLAECTEAMRELAALTEPQEWDGWIGNNHYWISITERCANEIPDDLEGDELDEFIEKLNEEGW